jgi:integrase/recombinase XerC
VSYATRNRQPPRTIPDDELARLLKISGKHRDTYRDHMILSVAAGLGLRKMEIAALNVGDVATEDAKGWLTKPKRMIQLRVFAKKGRPAKKPKPIDPKQQRVHLADSLFYKLEKYLRVEFRERGHKPVEQTPLFVGRGGTRISTRRIHELFHEWQRRAKFEHIYSFHELRHTCLTNVYRLTRDIRIAQRQARHVDIQSTLIYEHASDQEVATAIRRLAC